MCSISCVDSVFLSVLLVRDWSENGPLQMNNQRNAYGVLYQDPYEHRPRFSVLSGLLSCLLGLLAIACDMCLAVDCGARQSIFKYRSEESRVEDVGLVSKVCIELVLQ